MSYPRRPAYDRRSPLGGTKQLLGPEDNQADNDPQEHLAPPDVRRRIHRERDLAAPRITSIGASLPMAN